MFHSNILNILCNNTSKDAIVTMTEWKPEAVRILVEDANECNDCLTHNEFSRRFGVYNKLQCG